jgi:hypothetical protein
MNLKAKGKNIDWRRVAGIAIVLLIVGYQYSRPTLERWFDRELPTLTGENDQAAPRTPSATESRSDHSKPDPRYEVRLPNGNSDSKSARTNNKDSDFLRSVGRNHFMSPEGLLYTMGPKGEHRVDHVMRHGDDMPNRPVHSVFEGDKNDILALIDEAYSLVKANSPQVRSSDSRGNQAHTIKMQRKVGYEGGQKGKRKGYPVLKSVKLILDGNRVITAYPVR